MAIANITNNILVDSNIDVNSLELLSNKSTTTTLGTSDTLYPTQNAVKTYVDGKVKPVFYDTPIITHTGTTVYTNLSTISIPAGTIKENDVWEIEIVAKRTNVEFSNFAFVSCNFDTTTEGGRISSVSIGNGSNSRMRLQRSFLFKNGAYYSFGNSGSFYDDFQSIQSQQVVGFDINTVHTINCGIRLNSATNIAILDYIIFRKTN